MNADHKFAPLDWNYASVQDTAGHSELKSIDDDFPTFKIDQNKPIGVGPSTTRVERIQLDAVDAHPGSASECEGAGIPP